MAIVTTKRPEAGLAGRAGLTQVACQVQVTQWRASVKGVTMRVLDHEIPNPPYEEEQIVLLVRHGKYELEAVREGEAYWLHLFVTSYGQVCYTRMVRPASTVEDVQREVLWMLKQGHQHKEG